jgi:hypothetical protein
VSAPRIAAGPWRVVADVGAVHVVAADGAAVCRIMYGRSDGTGEANAKAIALLPELLAAAREHDEALRTKRCRSRWRSLTGAKLAAVLARIGGAP